MKVYYDSDGTPTWVEITTVSSYPTITTRVDMPGTCMVELDDFEGALYSTWYSRNFTKMKIEDDSSNVLFIGYLTSKNYHHDKCVLIIDSFSKKLDWTRFQEDYILAEGYVEAVPHDGGDVLNVTDSTIEPDGDNAVAWNPWPLVGSHYSKVVDGSDDTTVTAGNGLEDAEEDFTLTTITVTEVQSIVITVRGKWIQNDKDITVDFYNGTGWEGAQAVGLTSSYADHEVTFSGMTITNAKLADCRIKLIANAAYAAGDYSTVSGISTVITYTGDSDEALGLCQDDDDRTAFDWDSDYWINNQNVGILIVDNTTGTQEETFSCTALNDNATGENEIGDHTGLTTEGDGYDYHVEEINETTFNCVVDLTVGGNNIADTNTLQYIEIEYNFKVSWIDAVEGSVMLDVKKDTSWIRVATGYGGTATGETKESIISGKVKYEDDLTEYLDKTGANYDSMKGMRFVFAGDYRTGDGTQKLDADFLKVTIGYHGDDISPIMEEIDYSGASFVQVSGVDWNSTGVEDGGADDGDHFKIGQNCEHILDDISNRSGITFNILDNASHTWKYIARHFKGLHCNEVLKSVLLLEGLHWAEDHANEEIYIFDPASPTDSGETFTSSNYDFEWIFEDKCNDVKRVDVWGNAAYNIHAFKEDVESSSLIEKQVIDESITTLADAQEVANNQYALLSTKQPSIKLVFDGVNSGIELGKSIDVTFSNPDIVSDDYVVRMIERERFGASIKTTVYIGMGHTRTDEKIFAAINKNYTLARKALTDRLISTPWSAGASIQWSDIGGAETAVESIITTEVGAGESIDNAIDTLIATHAADDDAHHAIPAECERLTPMYLLGDAGFTATLGRWEVAHSDVDARINANWVAHKTATYKVQMAHYSTVAARTDSGTLHVGIMQTTDTYSVSNEINAENYDLVNTVINTVYLTDSTSSFSVTKGDIITARFTKDNAAGTGTLRVIGMYLVEQ